MIISSTSPFSLDQIDRLREEFDTYIKTVIDLENKICVAGMDRHFEGEQILIEDGSLQKNIWGGGIDIETKEIDFNSFINIRPRDNNTKNELLDPELRKQYEKLTRFFFKILL